MKAYLLFIFSHLRHRPLFLIHPEGAVIYICRFLIKNGRQCQSEIDCDALRRTTF